MTVRVLLNKATGDLLLGYRVCFWEEPASSSFNIQFDYDGWIIEHVVSALPWFFNRKAEETFIDLGEL